VQEWLELQKGGLPSPLHPPKGDFFGLPLFDSPIGGKRALRIESEEGGPCRKGVPIPAPPTLVHCVTPKPSMSVAD
jgi:hypothetical protein